MSETFISKTYGKLEFKLPRIPNYIIRDENLKVPLTSFSDAEIHWIFMRMAKVAIEKKKVENHEQSNNNNKED